MGRDREQGLLQVHPTRGGNGPRIPNPRERAPRKCFPEKVLSKQSPGGGSQAKRRAMALQLEGREALPPLGGLQATQSRRQKLDRARAGVSAIGLRRAGARG